MDRSRTYEADEKGKDHGTRRVFKTTMYQDRWAGDGGRSNMHDGAEWTVGETD
jgi:hypothetical protein